MRKYPGNHRIYFVGLISQHKISEKTRNGGGQKVLPAGPTIRQMLLGMRVMPLRVQLAMMARHD